MEINWIENLRSLLNLARSEYEMGKDQAAPFSGSWAISILSESTGRVDLCLKDALAIIPNEPEMMKLLRWLKGREADSIQLYLKFNDEIDDGMLRAWKQVMDYIKQEFRYTLEEPKG